MAQYKMELKQHGKSLLVWCVCQWGLILMGYVEFLFVFRGDERVSQVIKEFPPAFSALFGIGSGVDFSTAQGFYMILTSFVFYVLAAYASLLGVEIFAKEQSGKTAEFLFSKPISRGRVFGVKFAAGVTLCGAVSLVMYLSFLATFGMAGAAAAGAVTSFLIQLVYFSAGAMFAALCGKTSRAGTCNLIFLLVTMLSGKLFAMAGVSGPVMAVSLPDYFPMERYFSTGGFGIWPWAGSVLWIVLFIVAGYRGIVKKDL